MPLLTSASSRRIICCLKQSPVGQKLQARFYFDVAVTVETDATVNFQDACRWAFPPDDGGCQQLQGRIQPRLLYPEAPYCLWNFEFDEDAILFLARFGGVARRNLDVDQWRRRMSA